MTPLTTATDKATRIADLLAGKVPTGTTVTIQGWVRTRRDSKAGLSFINVHDGSCFDPIQVVAPGPTNEGGTPLANYESEILKLTTGCSIIVRGLLVESQGKGQSVEIQAETIEVVGWVDDPDTYPVAAKRHTFEYLREVAHLRPRTNTFGAIARVRHCLAMAVHRFYHERGFYWIHTPIITASDAEGAGEMFRVSTLDMTNLPRIHPSPPGRGAGGEGAGRGANSGAPSPQPLSQGERGFGGESQRERELGEIDFSQDFFGREAHLTVSGQLNVECYCLALSKVYTFGPTFRAENSNTSRHLAEFWMIEPEIAFADLNDNADLAEDFLKYIFRTLLDERSDDMAFFAQRIEKDAVARLEKFIDASFERMDYTEAIDILCKAATSGRAKFEFPVKWGVDLQSEHERYLTEKHVGRPVVVMNYPKEIKAFYMRLNDDEKTVAAMDVLAPGIGEIIGGSQREDRLEVLDRRIDEMGLEKDAYWWYRDLRRYGTVPHAGFGLGFERTIQYATGMANIRDVIPFPRTPGNAEF